MNYNAIAAINIQFVIESNWKLEYVIRIFNLNTFVYNVIGSCV